MHIDAITYLFNIIKFMLTLQVLHFRANAVAKLEYSRRVLYLVVCGHIEA